MPDILNTDINFWLTGESGLDGDTSVCIFTDGVVVNSILESTWSLKIGLLAHNPIPIYYADWYPLQVTM
jgi:hypothetical protein